MEEIIAAAARAAWVCAWADAEEENGKALRGELMDQAPPTPERALEFARAWAERFREFNGCDLVQAYERAAALPGKHRREPTREDFGHYSMMQAMGHGVAWCDDHPRHDFRLPYVEFHVFGDGEIDCSVSDRAGLATRG